MIVAHRGASGDAPENTIPAFKLGWKQGADAIEGDFRLTKDGHIVCIHDENTKRVSGKNLIIRQTTLAELRALDVGVQRGEAFKGTSIPTVAEVFATIPERKTIFIEIKSGVEIIPRLLQEINRSGLTKDQIHIICFDAGVIHEMKIQAPQYEASWLCSLSRDLCGRIKPSLETVLLTLAQVKADGLAASCRVIDEVFVRRIKDAGYAYHCWTVDDVPTAKRLREVGANAIITNVPGYIIENLKEEVHCYEDI